MHSVKLYTIGCPQCNVLYKKMKKKGIEVELIQDPRIHESLDIKEFPKLSVDDGPLMGFKEANQWVNNWRHW